MTLPVLRYAPGLTRFDPTIPVEWRYDARLGEAGLGQSQVGLRHLQRRVGVVQVLG